MIKIVEGNILNAKEDVIVQQVNSMGKMGSGLAKQIRAKYPIVYEEYSKFCSERLPDDMLGECQIVECPDGKFVANLFGQKYYGNDGKKYTEINSLEDAMWTLMDACKIFNKSLAIPEGIGCGLGGESWVDVLKVIERLTSFTDCKVVLYRYKGE